MSNTRNRAAGRTGKARGHGKASKSRKTTVRVLVDKALKSAYSRYAPGGETTKALRNFSKLPSVRLN